jgi:hypothetical protein
LNAPSTSLYNSFSLSFNLALNLSKDVFISFFRASFLSTIFCFEESNLLIIASKELDIFSNVLKSLLN